MVAATRIEPAAQRTRGAGDDPVHVVERGDTLWQIAREAGVTLQDLLAANPQVRNPDLIHVGDRIRIPAAGATAPQAPATGNASALSAQGLELIQGFESLRLNAYQDSAGVWTIGWGHTGGVRPGDRITRAQADAYLQQDTGWAQQAVSDLVHVPLTQGQFDALTSFTFNVGRGALEDSTLLRKLNAGDYAGAQAQFGRWVHAGGEVLQGLVRRRAAEAELFGAAAPRADEAAPNGAAGIARQFLGRNASELKRSGDLPMDASVPSNVCCANFVSAVLQRAGLLPASAHTNSVDRLDDTLRARGWRPVDAAHARPGDVVTIQGGGVSHTVMVESNDNGRLRLIGSNNVNADGTQRITTSSAQWAIAHGAVFLTPGNR